MGNIAKILLVEDNEGDILLIMRALAKVNLANDIKVARDGNEALMYLRKEGIFRNAETPDLILLDINLPKIDGMEVLIEIKSDETLRIIPVLMLTTSDSEKDIIDSYYNHANCYITKPADFNKLLETVKVIKDYWISIAKLPKHAA